MRRSLILFVFLIFFASCVSAQLYEEEEDEVEEPRKKVPDLTRICLDCLCKGSTGCNQTLKCHNYGVDRYYCGAFAISWAYWHDSGRPNDRGGPIDYETCLNDLSCAEAAVRGYMQKYGKDCDGNGEIDCYDFARIQIMGAFACGDPEFFETQFFKRFDECYSPEYKDNF